VSARHEDHPQAGESDTSPDCPVQFISDVPTATFQCKLGTHRYKACTSPHVITVRPGRHAFKVRAKLGNAIDPTPAAYRWRVRR
jgi:hypothetical protein